MDNPILKTIGDRHGLHIDQLGLLEEEVSKVMSGQGAADEFVANVEDRLGLSAEQAIDLATDVNVEIFLPARQSAMQRSSAAPESMEKDDILAEIENPTPAVHPISAAVPPTAPQRPSDDHSKEQAAAQEVAHDFIGGKLAEPVSLPTKKAAVDPYREPLN